MSDADKALTAKAARLRSEYPMGSPEHEAALLWENRVYNGFLATWATKQRDSDVSRLGDTVERAIVVVRAYLEGL